MKVKVESVVLRSGWPGYRCFAERLSEYPMIILIIEERVRGALLHHVLCCASRFVQSGVRRWYSCGGRQLGLEMWV